MNAGARLIYVVVCVAGMAGFMWFMKWLFTSHSKDFGTGLVTGIGLMVALHLAHHLLTRGRSPGGLE